MWRQLTPLISMWPHPYMEARIIMATYTRGYDQMKIKKKKSIINKQLLAVETMDKLVEKNFQ